jgi:hypothetical protein
VNMPSTVFYRIVRGLLSNVLLTIYGINIDVNNTVKFS